MRTEKVDFLRMARGAIAEAANAEISKVIDNVFDPNTVATDKRKVVVTLEIMPEEDRATVRYKAGAAAVLAKPRPVSGSLVVGVEGGKPVMYETIDDREDTNAGLAVEQEPEAEGGDA